MKKALVILLTGAIMAMSVACGGGSSSNTASAPKEEAAQEEKKEEETVVSEVAEDTAEVEMNVPEDPMTYEEYAAAAVDTEGVIKGAVQAKQAYYAEKSVASVYLQDETGGAYFLYELPCTEKEYELLEVGKFIKVRGYKAMWPEVDGEVEITEAIWQFEDGEYIAEPEDVTALLGTDELVTKMNKKVVFKGVKVEPIKDKDGNDVAFNYGSKGTGTEGDDLYFNVSVNGQTYTFTVESYLCGPDTDIYKAVKDFHVGDVIDLEGFLYWYEGPNPHITAVLAQ